jgi:tetratricopeptide (TPR) repeat protein
VRARARVKTLNRVENVLVIALVVAAPLALGGVHPITALVLAWGAAALFVFALRARWAARDGAIALLSIPALGLLGAALVCLLQLIPVPPALLALLDGRAAGLYAQGWALVGEGAAPWRPISLDPARTADAAVRWLTLGLLAASITNMSPSARFIQRAVMASGAATLLVGVAQRLLGAERFWGFYESSVGVRGASTFVSNNHASAFFGLVGLAAALSMVPSRGKSASPSQLIVGGLVASGAAGAMIWHQSVGTLLAAALCASAPLLLVMGQLPAVRKHVRTLGGVVGLIALASVGVAPLVWPLLGPGALAWFGDSAPVRVDMARAALRAALDAPISGVGAGAVERVIYPYMDWSLQRAATIPTIEAEPIEWLLTLGIPATLLLWGAMGAWGAVMLRSRDGRSQRPAAPGQLALVAYVALISFVHFPFFTLGLSIPAVALLESGIVRARPRRKTLEVWSRDGIWFGLPRRVMVAGCVAVLAALLGLTARWTKAETWSDTRFAAEITPALAREAEVAVPTEGRLHYQLARQALDAGELERALKHAELAWALEPVGKVAMLRAHVAARAGSSEAPALWAALFDGRFKGDEGAQLTLMLRDLPSAEERATALTRAPSGRWEQAITQVVQREGLDEAVALADALMDARPDTPAPGFLLIQLYLANGRPALAELWAENLGASAYPDHPETSARAALWVVRSLRAQGREEEALARLDEALEAAPQDMELAALALVWAPLDALLSDAQAARLERAAPVVCSGGEHARQCTLVQAALKERDGRVDEAAELLQGMAWRLDDPMPLAQLYVRQGRCLQLRAFEAQWRDRHSKKVDKRLTAASSQCGGSR